MKVVRYDVVRVDPATEIETTWHLYNQSDANDYANELRGKYPWCEVEVRPDGLLALSKETEHG